MKKALEFLRCEGWCIRDHVAEDPTRRVRLTFRDRRVYLWNENLAINLRNVSPQELLTIVKLKTQGRDYTPRLNGVDREIQQLGAPIPYAGSTTVRSKILPGPLPGSTQVQRHEAVGGPILRLRATRTQLDNYNKR